MPGQGQKYTGFRFKAPMPGVQDEIPVQYGPELPPTFRYQGQGNGLPGYDPILPPTLLRYQPSTYPFLGMFQQQQEQSTPTTPTTPSGVLTYTGAASTGATGTGSVGGELPWRDRRALERLINAAKPANGERGQQWAVTALTDEPWNSPMYNGRVGINDWVKAVQSADSYYELIRAAGAGRGPRKGGKAARERTYSHQQAVAKRGGPKDEEQQQTVTAQDQYYLNQGSGYYPQTVYQQMATWYRR